MAEIASAPSEARHALTERPRDPIPRPEVRGRHRMQPPRREGLPIAPSLVALGVLASGALSDGRAEVQIDIVPPKSPVESPMQGSIEPVPMVPQDHELENHFDAAAVVAEALKH